MRLPRKKRLPLDALAPYLASVPPAGPIDWRAVFPQSNPVEIEVGFGKGGFLIDSALAHPERNYFGIEIDRALQLYTATRAARRGLANLRVARGEACAFLRDHVAAGSVRAVHTYFPDPWWKKRHQKRRLFTPAFAAQCARVLIPGGMLHVATDVEEYYRVMLETLAAEGGLVPAAGEGEEKGLATNFERKALARGEQVWRASFRKD